MNISLVKITTISISILFMGMGQIYSQTGCTDPLANNYNPAAMQNDGSCTYNSVAVSTTNTYQLDAELAETSGLIYWEENLWTHNDSDDNNLYKLNPSNGSIVSEVSLEPLINVDWEEISQDDDYIYLGDFGNNLIGNRIDLKIIRVTKVSIQAGTPEFDFINFAYEDQVDFTPQGPNNTDYDCEAFIVTTDAIFLFTKEWVSNKTRLYKIPKIPGTYQAELQDTYDIDGLLTGAVYKKNENIIALSGYSNFLQPFVFLLYDYFGEDFFGANKRKLGINLPFHQVEGITTNDGLNYYISNERFNSTGTIQKLHTLNLTPYLDQHLSILSIEDNEQFKIFPNPTTSLLEIVDIQNLFPLNYIIFDTATKKVKEGTLSTQHSTIDVSELSIGNYILKIGEKASNSFKIIKE